MYMYVLTSTGTVFQWTTSNFTRHRIKGLPEGIYTISAVSQWYIIMKWVALLCITGSTRGDSQTVGSSSDWLIYYTRLVHYTDSIFHRGSMKWWTGLGDFRLTCSHHLLCSHHYLLLWKEMAVFELLLLLPAPPSLNIPECVQKRKVRLPLFQDLITWNTERMVRSKDWSRQQ